MTNFKKVIACVCIVVFVAQQLTAQSLKAQQKIQTSILTSQIKTKKVNSKQTMVAATRISSTKPTIKIVNLNVNLYPQTTKTLCWAASMQMILNYLGSKCTLDKIAQLRPLSEETPLCNVPTSCTDDNCENQINQDDIEIDQLRDAETVLSRLKYYSNIETDTLLLNWTVITKQIKRCHPLLLTLANDENNGKHMVVVKGYWTFGNKKFLIINDPWGNCRGQRYSLEFSKLYNTSSSFHAISAVININKKANSTCLTCGSHRTLNTFSGSEKYIQAAYSPAVEFIKDGLNSNKNIAKSVVEVKIISSVKLQQSNSAQMQDIYANKKMVDVIIDEHTVVRFQKFEGRGYEVTTVLENFYKKTNNKYPTEYWIYPKLHQGFFVNNNAISPHYDIGAIYRANEIIPKGNFTTSLKEIDLKINNNFKKISQERAFERINTSIEKYNRYNLPNQQLRVLLPSINN